MTWLPLALLLLGPAWAGDGAPATTEGAAAARPLPADPAAWTVADYNDAVVRRNDAMVRDVNALRRTLARRDIDVDSFLAQGRQTFVEGERALRSLPPWKGDASLRDVAADATAWAIRAVDQDCAEIRALMRKEDVVAADLERVDALLTGLEAEGARWDAQVRNAQAVFAKRHGLLLVHGEHDVGEPPEPPSFSAPGIPPEGSRLPATGHVDFAIRYRNPFVVDQGRLVEAMNAMFEASGTDGDAMETARAAALEVARDVRARADAREGWFGDEGLRAATRDTAKALADALQGPAAVAARGRAQGFRKQAEVDRYNDAVKELNDATTAAMNGFAAADAAFQERWGLAAYAAWQEKHPKE